MTLVHNTTTRPIAVNADGRMVAGGETADVEVGPELQSALDAGVFVDVTDDEHAERPRRKKGAAVGKDN